ncbi:MAG: transporter substrate-binding domain-containing protein, partial [Bryobacterales bacterium]|nr:transporter substrate-binding domain-containing protein [Bryobacterales bacterium]
MAFVAGLTLGVNLLGSTPVVRVPFGQAPPMTSVDASGKPAGFAVQTMEEAARRAGLTLRWLPGSTPEGNDRALEQNRIDLILGPATDERRRLFYVSGPWWSSEIVAIVSTSSPITTEAALRGRPIALAPGASVALPLLQPPEPVLRTANVFQTAEMVCRGKVDAGIFAAMFLRELLAQRPAACRHTGLRTIDLSVTADFVLTVRHDSAAMAERLKAALDDLTADGTLTAIAAQNPPMSTPQATRLAERLRARYTSRLWTIGLAGAALFVLLVSGAILRLQRSRRRLAGLNRQLAEDLELRARAEKALRESELRFGALIDSAPQTVLAVDTGGLIAYANAKTESMFGRGARSLTGQHIGALFPSRLSSPGKPGWWRELDSSNYSPEPVRGFCSDGAEFPVHIDYGTVPGADGLTIVFIQDVSERLALERQVREAQRLESIGQLAGGVAHDFNNLLTVISGYADLALGELPLESRIRSAAEKIKQASSRAAALTRQLLTFSRRQAVEPRIISLNDLVSQLNSMLRPLIREDIELVLGLDASPSWIYADPGQVEQALMNLVVNARDAMPDGGRLTVQTRNNGEGDVVLRVEDTGVGMTSEVQARIFDPFFTTKPQGQGTGLGLSVVYGIVRQNGASISVASQPDEGSVFEIRFPPAKAQPSPSEPDSAMPPQPRLGRATVLLAEDDPNVRDFVAHVLRLRGYTVLEAANGREALSLIDVFPSPIDLLLTDTVMPEVGGAVLSRAFKQRFPGTPILQMTGYAEGQNPVTTDIPMLNKPFSAT